MTAQNIENQQQKPRLQRLNDLKIVFHRLFVQDDLLLDMDDYEAIFEALLVRNNIKIPSTWSKFIYEINCEASTHFWYFNTIFNKHFKI